MDSFQSAADIISLILFIILGLCLAIGQRPIFQVPVQLSIAMLAWHTMFSFLYLYVTLTSGSDSIAYYIKSFSNSGEFYPGTLAVVYFTSFFTQLFSSSLGSVFLFFSLAGYVGLIAFLSALLEVTERSSRNLRYFVVLIAFLPGVSFWSSGLGKDSLSFFSSGLACWAALRISTRYPALIAAAVVLIIVRPHMAGILLISLCIGLFFSRKMNILYRFLLLGVAVPATVFGIVFALNYIGLDDSASFSEISEYIETRQGYNLGGATSVDISSMSIIRRFFTYLFLPIFLGSPGIMGLIVSLENIILLIFSVFFFLVSLKRTRKVPSFFFFFSVSFFSLSLFVLSSTTSNLGIALRQKWMFLPIMIVLLLSYSKNFRKPLAIKIP